MNITQLNIPEVTQAGGIVIASSAIAAGTHSVWKEILPDLQTPFFYNEDGFIDVMISHEMGNNVFRFTKTHDVSRLSHEGPLLDVAWWDIVKLAEDDVQSRFSPIGVDVIGNPWILKDPIHQTDVGLEPDWVVSETDGSFDESSPFAVKLYALKIDTPEEDELCAGVFQGEPKTIHFRGEYSPSNTYSGPTIMFRRHLLNCSFETDGNAGTCRLIIDGLEAECIAAGGDIFAKLNTQEWHRRNGITILANGALDALAAIERYEKGIIRKHDTSRQFPGQRMNKRDIFKKR